MVNSKATGDSSNHDHESVGCGAERLESLQKWCFQFILGDLDEIVAEIKTRYVVDTKLHQDLGEPEGICERARELSSYVESSEERALEGREDCVLYLRTITALSSNVDEEFDVLLSMKCNAIKKLQREIKEITKVRESRRKWTLDTILLEIDDFMEKEGLQAKEEKAFRTWLRGIVGAAKQAQNKDLYQACIQQHKLIASKGNRMPQCKSATRAGEAQ